MYYGVHLTEKRGQNDGSHTGSDGDKHVYFKCPAGHGVLTTKKKIEKGHGRSSQKDQGVHEKVRRVRERGGPEGTSRARRDRCQ